VEITIYSLMTNKSKIDINLEYLLGNISTDPLEATTTSSNRRNAIIEKPATPPTVTEAVKFIDKADSSDNEDEATFLEKNKKITIDAKSVESSSSTTTKPSDSTRKNSKTPIASNDDLIIPDYVKIKKDHAEKYFGNKSKAKFYEQYHTLKKKKEIISTNVQESIPPSAISVINTLRANDAEDSDQEDEIPVDPTLKIDTKIIIRTQVLSDMQSFDQMKLIQKPKTVEMSASRKNSQGSEVSKRSEQESQQVVEVDADDEHVDREDRSEAKPSMKFKPLQLTKDLTKPKSNVTKLSPLSDDGLKKRKAASSNNDSSRETNSGRGKKEQKPTVTGNAGKSDVSNYLHEMRASFANLSSARANVLERINSKKTEKKSDLSFDIVNEQEKTKIEFVCIDHRDAYNKKIQDQLTKRSSLFQYVDSKIMKRDFYDDYSDHHLLEEEIQQMKAQPIVLNSPIRSPLPPIKKDGKGKSQPITEEKQAPIEFGALSPRSHYIDSCIRKRLNPRASLILRKRFTRELNLKHLGMGDKMALLLAEAIVNVPYIHSLNVRDNNLNDEGLSAIVNAIQNMTELVELDMSYNVIGSKAANSLAAYLSIESCPLERLVLQKADVDDDECRDFVMSLLTNRKLKEIDLSENLVGSSENLNTVMPDLTTGGEALAELLQTQDCPLQTLKLGWNLIRLDGAATLCSSLSVNQSLTYLDLSYNSLSNNGGMALGDALQDNKVLKTLHVSNNSLDSIACLTICAGIFQNEALESVVFDGNPIGEQGAKVLMVSSELDINHYHRRLLYLN
jgi:Ran GTPase-activating protein (RanGAP) involved in mRNA processing and transport